MDVRKEMKVESVEEDEDKVTVATTGAKYIIDKSGKFGKISCYQMLNEERLLATIEFNHSFSTLSVEGKDNLSCVFHQQTGGKISCSFLRLQINSDSLLDIYSTLGLNLSFSGNFLAEYSAQKDGNVLLIDKIGGIGIYPYQGFKNIEHTNFTDKEWKINYVLSGYSRFFVSVFPPRKFNFHQSFEERIVHHGTIGPWVVDPHPTDEMLEEANKYANVLVLHEGIWQGKLTRIGKPLKTLEDIYAESAYCCFNYLPVDEKELIRVVKKAHSLKMKVIPYMSPFFSMAKGQDYLERLKITLDKYEFDGVYFDGISQDILYSYQMIQDARALLKDKILYVHCTSDPMKSVNIYCPFIDTYADYILRAEGLTSFTDKYVRYVISGYNISNSIGYICYYHLPLDFMHKFIDKTLNANARFYLGSPETEREKLLKKEYFSKLQIEKEKQWKKKSW
ncbi:hypothetical protein AUJ66_04545 [Candidatus Desantisbacteria bacterium CG1_02_38_46]|uniref:Uncharacterized protein n=3 Tax=unclassified Candidatus Desantisiibacteriota TaxID=3106372 RepID=A0A2H9PAV6_9BACT|nr:MAG: hypothetical protein AUJ66_04545 [Candidatus Desantisbacteria bacterium CG1_02_38_46]PIU50764.1 MAG: hypothetical protein COS91_08010 [Candidatus Desantisbacteria bacterium CG07_land_8_20_14_0_80_39_15]PIZ15705.1 MAG: hypothetical protein COY51_04550 [Candidatus Desantisbacteria bacterium CG_4_10_14_0_8_um_filter_39_17]